MRGKSPPIYLSNITLSSYILLPRAFIYNALSNQQTARSSQYIMLYLNLPASLPRSFQLGDWRTPRRDPCGAWFGVAAASISVIDNETLTVRYLQDGVPIYSPLCPQGSGVEQIAEYIEAAARDKMRS